MKIVGLLYNTKTVASLTFTETSNKSTSHKFLKAKEASFNVLAQRSIERAIKSRHNEIKDF